MASFNVKPDAQLTPNYTGASQGIQASPNTAIGTLFEGLAGALDTGIKEADRSTQEQIRNEIFDQVDSIQDEFGVSSSTLFQEDSGSTAATPPALNDAGRHLQGLQSQYERGGIKESHYWARMNSMVRQIRGRYPGYRAEIDSMVSGIVGARPANALRSALFNEWEDAASSSNQQLKDYNNLVEWALKANPSVTGRTYLPSDFLNRQQNGQPYSMTELQAWIQDVQAEEGRIQSSRTRMAMEIENQSFQSKKAERAFRTESTSFVNGILGDTSNQLGRSYYDITQQVDEARRAAMEGAPLSAEMVQTQAAQISELKSGMLLALNQKFTESWDGNPEHSYAAHLSNEERQSIIATAMQPINLLEDAILSQDYGTVNSVAAYLKAQESQDTRELLDKIPVMSTLQALKTVAGPDVLGLYLSLNPPVQSEITKVLLDYHRSRGAMGDGSVTEAFAAGDNADQQKDYYDGLITSWQRTINEVTSNRIPPEMIANNVNFMFGQEALGVMAQMTPESRYEYFRKVASPQVTQQMLSLKKMGDVDSWNTYQSWVASSFVNLFQSAASGISQSFPKDYGLEIVWDPTTYGFKAVGQAPDSQTQALGGVLAPIANARTEAARGTITRELAHLNTAVRTIAPIFEENGGDTGEELLSLLEQMGYDENRQDGLADLYDALKALVGQKED